MVIFVGSEIKTSMIMVVTPVLPMVLMISGVVGIFVHNLMLVLNLMLSSDAVLVVELLL